MENPSKNEQSKGFWRANSAGAHWGCFVGTWVEWKSPSSMGYIKLKTKVFERNCCFMFFQACWWAENMIALLFKRLAWRALYVIYPTNVGSLLKLHCTNVVYMQHSSLYTLRQEHSKTQWWSSDLSRLQWRDREDLRFLENSPETLRLGIKFMLKRVTRWGGYVGVHPLF